MMMMMICDDVDDDDGVDDVNVLSSQQAHACMDAPSLFPLSVFFEFWGPGERALSIIPLPSWREGPTLEHTMFPCPLIERRNLVLSMFQ